MPVGTIVVHGTDGFVMAPLGNGSFIEGKRLTIRVTSKDTDEDVSEEVREALVGLTISTIFSSEQVNGGLGKAPEGCRLAYVTEVAEALTEAGKVDAAKKLLLEVESYDPGADYSFLVFKQGEFEIIPH